MQTPIKETFTGIWADLSAGKRINGTRDYGRNVFLAIGRLAWRVFSARWSVR